MNKDNTNGNVEAVEDGGLRPAITPDGEHLNPQPSNDPADPLNWPMGLKVCTSYLSRRCILLISVRKGRSSGSGLSSGSTGNSEHCDYQPRIRTDG